MRSNLTITTPAPDRLLLSIEEMRVAAGLAESDSTQDAALIAAGHRVADLIAIECNVAIGNGGDPTLRQETLTESFRRVNTRIIALARRHNIIITSIIEDDVAIDAADYDVDSEAGLIHRYDNSLPSVWYGDGLTIVYKAGFATVPADLKAAATEFFRASWLESTRDPLVKSVEKDIPGVMRVKQDLWVGAVPGRSGEGTVPSTILGSLKRFRNTGIA